jgi:hypothetical protein
MIAKGLSPDRLRLFSIGIALFFSAPILAAADHNHLPNCINQAVKRIMEIRSLPEMKYLHTLDDQHVPLDEFYTKSHYLFPQCCLFKKFYYWRNEIREVFSNTLSGMIKHKIRCYYNCLSTYCPNRCDPRKTHGDVAEFYDQKGVFMGLAVYIGDGKYCVLPYNDYKK